jgi:hypothetical protein
MPNNSYGSPQRVQYTSMLFTSLWTLAFPLQRRQFNLDQNILNTEMRSAPFTKHVCGNVLEVKAIRSTMWTEFLVSFLKDGQFFHAHPLFISQEMMRPRK